MVLDQILPPTKSPVNKKSKQPNNPTNRDRQQTEEEEVKSVSDPVPLPWKKNQKTSAYVLYCVCMYVLSIHTHPATTNKTPATLGPKNPPRHITNLLPSTQLQQPSVSQHIQIRHTNRDQQTRQPKPHGHNPHLLSKQLLTGDRIQTVDDMALRCRRVTDYHYDAGGLVDEELMGVDYAAFGYVGGVADVGVLEGEGAA